MTKNRKTQYRQTALEVILVGIFKLIWWLVTLPLKFIFKNRSNRRGRDKMTGNDRAYIVSQRIEIEKLLESESVIELKHAVMEADKIVDYILKAKGCAGETLADRLRSAEASMDKSVYNSIWEGHKVRNQIAHEQELRISNQELREAAERLLRYGKTL